MSHTTFLTNNFEHGVSRPARALVVSEQVSQRAFFAISALLFAASTMVTAHWCNSMSAMGEMAMPNGWTMSMAWMRMPGQTWMEATASFLAMWVAMMAAMMLPSLTSMLWRYRQSIGRTDETLRVQLTALAGLGYFFIWTLFGLAVFPLGVALAALEMKLPVLARAVPGAAGAVILIAGTVQLTKWKAHHLACCREAPGRDCVLSAQPSAAWKLGLRFGVHCGLSCANLTAILLVVGVMDLRAMAAITAAITAERLAPAGKHVAQAIGFAVAGAGLIMVARAAGLR